MSPVTHNLLTLSSMWDLRWTAATFVVVVLASLVVRSVVLNAAGKWARPGSALATLADTVRRPSLLWIVVLGIYVAVDASDLPRRFAVPFATVLRVAIILSVTMTAADLLGTLIKRGGERQALGLGVTGLGHSVARGLVWIVGGLVLLSAIGVQITPILTALGVGGLAVALALQDTLSNLFAGVHILADKPIRVGDYAKLAEGVEGFVVDIGWRSTRLRTFANNIVIVPNKKVAESIITNYDLPDAFTGLSVKIVVDYSADADRIESLLLDELQRAAREVPGIQSQPAPVVRLVPGFGDNGLEFTLSCQVASDTDQGLVQHELRKRVLRRFRTEGIPIPPARTVTLREAAALLHRPEEEQRTDHRQS